MKPGKLAAIAIGVFGLAQLIPYGGSQLNPSERSEPEWGSAEVRTLFFRACRDCHSNETSWPWYSRVAPASWLLQYDVDHGRSHLNVSDWQRSRPRQHGDDAAEMVRTGEMPPWYYLPLHPEARLSAAERERLIAGLVQTFGEGSSEPHEHGDHEHGGHDH